MLFHSRRSLSEAEYCREMLKSVSPFSTVWYSGALEATPVAEEEAHVLFVEPAVTGKVELVYEGEQEGAQNVARLLIGRATKAIFTQYFPDPADKKSGRSPYQQIINWFSQGNSVHLKHAMSFKDYEKALLSVKGLEDVVTKYTTPESPGMKVTAMEFILDALHQHSLIGKDYLDNTSTYSDMMGSMLSSIGPFEDDEDLDDEDFYGNYR